MAWPAQWQQTLRKRTNKKWQILRKISCQLFSTRPTTLATLLINCERKLCKTKQEISNCRRGGPRDSASSGKFAAAASELLKCVRRTLTAAGLIHAQFITIKGG